ncbi:hypothetical protein V4C53_30115 [Paraburkholderia azotifigens]|uniref:hypothetical protein n=1 Tax=Paraburkholderia azotifigens TaxID=2057004 RepID=UPI00316C9DB6
MATRKPRTPQDEQSRCFIGKAVADFLDKDPNLPGLFAKYWDARVDLAIAARELKADGGSGNVSSFIMAIQKFVATADELKNRYLESNAMSASVVENMNEREKDVQIFFEL